MRNKYLNIPVFYGTYADLTKIKVEYFNAKIVLFKGSKFRKSLKNILHPAVFKSCYTRISTDYHKQHLYENETIRRYAIVPIELDKPFEDKYWYHFYELMQSLYPSDFAIVHLFELEPYESGGYQTGITKTWDFKSTGEKYFDNYQIFANTEYTFVNTFLRKHFYSSFKTKYIKYMLSIFSNSFFEMNPTFRFLSSIICLEVVVEGKEQVTYRLKRNVALLCGSSTHTCKKIYKNVDLLYNFRSLIVHGSVNPSYKFFKEYNTYLKALVARLIRELIVHNIPDISTLNQKLTELGFGQNEKISENYVRHKHPLSGYFEVCYTTLPEEEKKKK